MQQEYEIALPQQIERMIDLFEVYGFFQGFRQEMK